VPPQLPPLPPDDGPSAGLESRAVAQRLDLAAARLAGDADRAQYRLGRFYGLIPAAAVGPHAERELDGPWSVGPTAELPIPLFGQEQAELAGLDAHIRGDDERFAALAVRIRADVRRARVRLAAARARAEHYRATVIPLQTRVLAETQREYNAMLTGVFQLLQAKRDEIDAGRRYVEALTDYWLSRTELERSLGGDLGFAATPTPPEEPAAAAPTAHVHHGG